jgi:NADPH:quinone reductase-like Zn-dependent oxidoreductase
VAGVVEAVGKEVTDFQPGDEVFGSQSGAFAEYVMSAKRQFAHKPPNITFEQAAAVPVAGTTALQALRDKGGVASGQKVLVIGAGGGVGTFAIQIAKSYGAEVTGVTSTGNLEMVTSIGADHVVDYTREDFTHSRQRYDLIVDVAGSPSLSHIRRGLTLDGTLVLVGAGRGNPMGPMARPLGSLLTKRFVKQRMVFFLAQTNKEDMLVLKELLEAGKVTPVIDRTYPLNQTPEAIRYLETGQARGKVVITV